MASKKTLLYISFMRLGGAGTIGIKKKILSHIEEFRRNSLQVYYLYIDNGQLISNYTQADGIKFDAKHISRSLSESLSHLDYTGIDFVYIRFGGFSLEFFSLLKRLKTSGAHILLEIPTYPFVGEYMQKAGECFHAGKYRNFLGYCKALCTYPFYTLRIRKYVERIITYSDDSTIWGIDAIQTCNGVDTNDISDIKHTKRNKNEITLICVSSCVRWHGYDRVIEGLHRYYEGEHAVLIRLYIVGEGPETGYYKELVSKYNLQSKVIFYGSLYGKELDEVYMKSDIALDAMGRHRVGVYYNSSIKGKEYAFKGLPIISGVKTELDKNTGFPFYMRVPADETPINMWDVIEFMNKVECYENYPLQIRSYAELNFSTLAAMKPIVDYIKIDKTDRK